MRSRSFWSLRDTPMATRVGSSGVGSWMTLGSDDALRRPCQIEHSGFPGESFVFEDLSRLAAREMPTEVTHIDLSGSTAGVIPEVQPGRRVASLLDFDMLRHERE